MTVEEKLATLGLDEPDVEDLYRTNPFGAHYISHFPVQNLLYLSGTTPRKGGQPYLPGVIGKDRTVAQGADAARYAALTTLAAVKYGAADLLVELFAERGQPTRAAIGCQGLGGNASVEIIVTLLFSGTDVRPPLARDHFGQ